MRAWLQAARPLAHANIAPALIFGQALAYLDTGRFDIGLAALVHAFGVLDHLFIVFANDVADREVDAANATYTPFSGGSRVLVEGKLSPAALTAAATVAAVGLVLLSVGAAVFLARPALPVFAVLALTLLWAYSFPPLRLSYRGFGEIAQGLGVGVVLPLVGYYGQAGGLATLDTGLLAPTFLLAFASNMITALPDTPSDHAGGKRSWPVRRGESRARADALALTGVALVIAMVVSPELSWMGRLLAFGPSVALAALAVTWIGRADSENRFACGVFVLLAAGAGGVLPLTWSAALLSVG